MESTPDPTPPLQAVRANEQILGAMLVLHGLVHVAGFLLAFEIAEPKGFGYDDLWPAAGTGPGRFVGGLWLLAALGLVVAGARMAARRPPSIALLAGPLVLSVVVCLMSTPEALPGAVISAAVLAVMVVVGVRRRTFDSGSEPTRMEGSGS